MSQESFDESWSSKNRLKNQSSGLWNLHCSWCTCWAEFQFFSSLHRLNRSMWVFCNSVMYTHVYFYALFGHRDVEISQQLYQSVEKHEICLGLTIWGKLILSMINENGWISMLKCVSIDNWLDQFVEILFGTNFAQNFGLAEYIPKCGLGVFWFFLFIRWVENHSGMDLTSIAD